MNTTTSTSSGSSSDGTAPTNASHAKLASALLDDTELDAVLERVCSFFDSSSNPDSGTTSKSNHDAFRTQPQTQIQIQTRTRQRRQQQKQRQQQQQRLPTRLPHLDAALTGGLQQGLVVELSGEPNSSISTSHFCISLLVTSLLLYPCSSAAVIDSTGHFNVVRLLEMAREQLVLGCGGGGGGGIGGAVDEGEVQRLLERVKIMRVFDFEGVREALGEIERGLGAGCVQQEGLQGALFEDEEGEEVLVGNKEKKRTFVPDSEDEDEDEMLFETGVGAVEEAGVQQDVEKAEGNAEADEPKHMGNGSSTQNRIKFILVDNLTHVLEPMLRKDRIKATAQASAHLGHLGHLTHTHALHTILATRATAAVAVPRATTTMTAAQSGSAEPATRAPPTLHLHKHNFNPQSQLYHRST
ncbi:uncharacterized protein SETTUDRAFT_25394 [Exserohilum turcica Et28A]|uniref:DNA recombination and repair protein Rad51-like C-terminal domain-containing protein n=1 Tax=Exserohilum turcicum (strain 28A) TaxID=671987 RepID=R0KB05_EXST2|nr:uncharacterized protein SETTUDRAFT_25394 [Exserohilum turcica Et28A]EOA90108.1 hypothetical protein SETTUDRAFT_25394 [Exserohilum turcica Et28A]